MEAERGAPQMQEAPMAPQTIEGVPV
jgi:hypothetical protein